jgi:phage shock protein E
MKKNKSPQKVVIDVRRPDEFDKGHAAGSLNIPLQDMEQRLEEIRKLKQTPVLVCGGGMRHVKAFELLKSHGIDSIKGGGWKMMAD